MTSAQLAAAQQKETQRMAQEQELIHRQSETLLKAQCEIEATTKTAAIGAGEARQSSGTSESQIEQTG